MSRVILYYRFVPLPDPELVMCWQRALCEALGLRGRIIVSSHGINGTLGGPHKALRRYVRAMQAHSRFADTAYKWSDGAGDEFPGLSVKVRDELVTLAPDIEFDPMRPGTGLDPDAWHELLSSRDDLVLLDARNDYESDVGRFRGAVTPPIRAFREIKEVVASLDRSTPVATYCTGDVRCEYLSAYMRELGFDEVYHLDGGIVEYGKRYGNRGHWEGRCVVFDQRWSVAFGDDTVTVGACIECGEPSDAQANCAAGRTACHAKVVVCTRCASADPGGALCRRCRAANSGPDQLSPAASGSA